MFCAFWLRHVLRAATACNFSSLIWPDGSAPTALASATFRPSGATNHWKNAVLRDFPTCSRTCIFFLLTFPSLIFFLFSLSLLFYSLTLHLCFSSVHTVGSLTSKLASIIYIYSIYCRFSFSMSFPKGWGPAAPNWRVIGMGWFCGGLFEWRYARPDELLCCPELCQELSRAAGVLLCLKIWYHKILRVNHHFPHFSWPFGENIRFTQISGP